MDFSKVKSVHFIGIGGTPVAEIRISLRGRLAQHL